MWSCKDDVMSAGAGALGSDEEVKVCSAVLDGIVSRSDSLEGFRITQTPDSFLVGECNTDEWGTIKADLLTQFACPSGFTFPDSCEIDSIAFMMTYSSWFGDGEAPLRLSVYEMDKGTFIYDHVYSSQEDVGLYWSGKDSTHIVVADRTVVAAHPSDSIKPSGSSSYVPYIRFRMDDRLVKRMNTLNRFPSQEEFNRFFHGLYIKSTYGASTALYVSNITMVLYYHYFYETLPGSGEYGRLTDSKYLYANAEVRQVNHFSFPHKAFVVPEMQQLDSINFVVSPGYVYTVLTLPMEQYNRTILDSVTSNGRTLRPYINRAMMHIDVLNGDRTESNYSTWANPAPTMMLIVKDSLNDFFLHNHLPSSDYCMIATLGKVADANHTYHYSYDFDLSTMLQNELRHNVHSDVELVMIPVDVEYTTNSSSATVVSKVKVNQTITSTIVRSAQHSTDPIRLDVVFSGFTINSLH